MKDTEKEDISILLRYEVTEKEPCDVSRYDRNVYVFVVRSGRNTELLTELVNTESL